MEGNRRIVVGQLCLLRYQEQKEDDLISQCEIHCQGQSQWSFGAQSLNIVDGEYLNEQD